MNEAAEDDSLGNAPDTLRRKLAESIPLQDAVRHLALWFAVLRAPPYSATKPRWRLTMAFESVADHPVTWCRARSLRLPIHIQSSLAEFTTTESAFDAPDDLTRYILGRAAMKCMVDAPAESRGLSLAYDLLRPLGVGDLELGTDDELVATALPGTDARREIEAEARRLAADPTIAATDFDREVTSRALRAAAQPKSLAACSHWIVIELCLEFSFPQVFKAVAAADASFAAGLLALLRNPALESETLGAPLAGLSMECSGAVLPLLGPVFDTTASWTGQTAAWMIVLHVEDGLRSILNHQLQEVRKGDARPDDNSAAVAEEMSNLIDSILTRPDGPRLTLEWLARLTWSGILGTEAGEERINEIADLAPDAILLKALAARLKREDWANPIGVWRLFSGISIAAEVERGEVRHESANAPLPVWPDWRGQANPLVPIAVAVQLLGASDPVPVSVPAWMKLVFHNVIGVPCTRGLGGVGPTGAASHLEHPIGRSDGALRKFAKLWSDASSWRRTSECFVGFSEGSEALQPGIAMLRVGLRMLQFLAVENADVPGLPLALADAVEEVRNILPESSFSD